MKITDLSLKKEIAQALEERGYEDFTAIQELALPALLKGDDVIAEAPTGTGKTAAYCIPMLSKIDGASKAVQALVVCPTRELAIQVADEIKKFAKHLPLIHYAIIYGGQRVTTQLRELSDKPQIVVGTPGRLNDLIARGNLNLAKVNYLVLDECDEMLEMGFIRDVNKIIEKVVSPHQTALFSATISPEIEGVAKKYLSPDAQRFSIKRTPTQENQIAQKYILVKEDEKKDNLVDLLNTLSFRRAFIFCRTKHKVMQLERVLKKSTRHGITSLQGNLSQNKRDRAMKDFRDYEADVMVATDIAARGLDVNDVDLVINYDVPEEDEFYLHRIGRTGRVDKTGASYTFLTKGETYLIKKYEKMTHCPLEQYTINKGDVMKKYLESLEPRLGEDLTKEKTAIEEELKAASEKLGHPVTAEELAALLLKERMENPDSTVPVEKDYSAKHELSIEKNKERKVFVTDPNNQRFFINIGWKDGADEAQLKKFICQNAKGLEEADFADVFLKGTFSFFEVPKDSADAVVFGVENTSWGEKNVHVEKTERPTGDEKDKKDFGHHDHKDFHHEGGHHDFHGHGDYHGHSDFHGHKDYHHDSHFHRDDEHGHSERKDDHRYPYKKK
jgi:ATP-dependent RNA helicase DeaD